MGAEGERVMIRYFLNAAPCCDNQSADMDESNDGPYYKVEDVEPIIADRDIKAANLQLLAGLVSSFADKLDFDVLRAAVDLARSFKQ
jgi:hypothetical protein